MDNTDDTQYVCAHAKKCSYIHSNEMPIIFDCVYLKTMANHFVCVLACGLLPKNMPHSSLICLSQSEVRISYNHTMNYIFWAYGEYKTFSIVVLFVIFKL